MTDADVIAAIRKMHLKANIAEIERDPACTVHWNQATVDIGGTIFGPGPYLHVPISGQGWDGTRRRVYPPARLQRRLTKRWQPQQKPARGRA